MQEKKPCCAADALWRIRKIDVNGIPTGFSMLDETIQEVRELGLTDEREIRQALMERVGIYNYVPPGIHNAYADAMLKEYHNSDTGR